MEYIRGGQPEVGYTFHKDTGSRAMSSLSDRSEYNSQHRPYWQQLGATHIFVNAIHWLHWPCSVPSPSGFDRVGKMLAVKADLTIFIATCLVSQNTYIVQQCSTMYHEKCLSDSSIEEIIKTSLMEHVRC